MRLGINTFLFTSPFTTESVKLFPKFKQWGFESVEIPVEALEHIDPAAVKRAADKNGLVIGSICACMGPGRDFRGTHEEQETAMTSCKALMLHLDTFHMNIEEKKQPDAIRKAGRYLAHFHACGTDRGTPGNDSLQWKRIVQALKAIGYDGDVVIESFTTDVKVIARAAAIWRKIEPKREDIAVKGLANLHGFFGRKAKKASAASSGAKAASSP